MLKIFMTIRTILFVCITLSLKAYDYDLIVIGGGAAGTTAALTAAKIGKKVLIVEQKIIGGGRIWSGDIPFKTLFKKADIIYQAKKMPDFLVNLNQNTQQHLAAIRTTRQQIYELMNEKISSEKNISIIIGFPSFIDNHTIVIKNTVLTADKFIIATGSSQKISAIKGLDEVNYSTRETFFEQNDIPKSMIIVGGGPLGTEMASALNKLGVKVTLIMKYGMLLPTYDYELVNYLTDILVNEGVEVHCNMIAESVRKEENSIVLSCLDKTNNIIEFKANSLFLATGSQPNVEGLKLKNAGIIYNKNGIKISSTMQTNIPNIYACGDVVGLIILSRVAYFHAKTAVFHMFGNQENKKIKPNYLHVSKVVFTTPPLAGAGLSEQDARKYYGNKLLIYKYTYKKIEKAYIDDSLIGLAKFICTLDGKLIGAHVFGSYAADIIDTVDIGKNFSDASFSYMQKVRTSPNYFDILIDASGQCREDIKKYKSGFLNKIIAWIFG